MKYPVYFIGRTVGAIGEWGCEHGPGRLEDCETCSPVIPEDGIADGGEEYTDEELEEMNRQREQNKRDGRLLVKLIGA